LLPPSSALRPPSEIRVDDGGRKYLLNVGKLLPDYTAQQPRRQPSSGYVTDRL
jgi:hypothetical protein